MDRQIILQDSDIDTQIKKIANQIIHNNPSLENVVLVGIRTGGAFLAQRLQKAIASLNGFEPPLGVLDITLYRDDWTRIDTCPKVGKTEIPFSVDDKTVILVDDVLFTGRTVRAAIDALIDYGRPQKIELAILVDRGQKYREIPVAPNYVGGVWDTTSNQTINVYLKEAGHQDYVAIEEKQTA